MENKTETVHFLWKSGQFCKENDKEQFSKNVKCRRTPLKVFKDTPFRVIADFTGEQKAIEFIRKTR